MQYPPAPKYDLNFLSQASVVSLRLDRSFETFETFETEDVEKELVFEVFITTTTSAPLTQHIGRKKKVIENAKFWSR